MDQKGKRMAILVGCNYPNTPYELHGCVNDVLAMRQILMDRFSFDPNHIQMLTDADESGSATGTNIKKALAESGDVLFFHFSCHGSTDFQLFQPGKSRYYEAIVPSNLNLITNMDFQVLLNRVAKGATFIVLFDSSVSGDLIDQQIEPLGPTRLVPTLTQSSIKYKPISFESLLRHFELLTGLKTFDIGTHLLELFGGEVSSRFRMPPIEVIEREHEQMLLSGCDLSETSADVSPSGGRKAYGGFTNVIKTVLKAASSPLELTYRKLMVMARNVIRANGKSNIHACITVIAMSMLLSCANVAQVTDIC